MTSFPNTTPSLRSDSVRYAKLAARKSGFDFRLLDTHSGYLCRITDGTRSVLLGGGSVSSWPINTVTAASIASDKSFTCLVLRDRGMNVPRSETIFLSPRFRNMREPGRELSDLQVLLSSFRWPLIVKPNNGSRGAFVQLCSTPDEVTRHLENMGKRYDIGLLQEYIEGEEYRVFVFGSEAVFSYRKRQASLIADGVHSVRDLVRLENETLIGHGLDPIQIESTVFSQSLSTAGYALDDVPAKGARLAAGARANLSAGGKPENFTTETPKQLADVAVRATRELGLTVAGIDLILSAGTKDALPIILEVNSNPSIASLESIGRIDLGVEIFARMLRLLLREDRP